MFEAECIGLDVLVIGGGGAGAMAALWAAKEAEGVGIVEKGVFGRSGCTPMGAFSMCAAFGYADPADNPRKHLEDTLRGGKFINDQELVDIFTREALNTLTPELEKNLHEALAEGDADPEVFCMVISGAGRAFCAGYHMGETPERKGNLTDPAIYESVGEYLASVQVYDYQNVQHRQLDIWRLKKPVIAAVHGYCMGGGMWLAMACDMCYCSEDAVFGQPEVRHNSNSTFLIPALAGWHRAARYLYTGDHFDGKEAERIGIVNESVPADKLMPTVMALAERIAMVPPNSVRLMKRLVLSGFLAYGIGAAMEVCAPYSTLAHCSHGPERQAMFDAQKERGMKGYLEERDDKFLPEPFGPKSKPKMIRRK